jgi:peptide chain release factor 3
MQEFKERNEYFMAKDTKGNDVFLAETEWSLSRAQEKFPDVKFHFKSEI